MAFEVDPNAPPPDDVPAVDQPPPDNPPPDQPAPVDPNSFLNIPGLFETPNPAAPGTFTTDPNQGPDVGAFGPPPNVPGITAPFTGGGTLPVPPPQPGGGTSSGGGGGGGAPSPGLSAAQQAASTLDQQLSKLLDALSATNEQDFNEKVREFNATHDLAVQQFNQGVNEFNQNLAEKQREFGIDTGEKQREFNVGVQENMADLAGRLTGPKDYFQFLNATNAGRNIIQSIQNGQERPAFTGIQNTQPMTVSDILNQLGLGAPTANSGNAIAQAATGAPAGGAPLAAAQQQFMAQAAPMQAQGPTGPLNQFGTAGPAPGATQTSVAPGQSGPTTPENAQFGIGPASQDFGFGPGKGGVDVSGQRGISQPTYTGLNIGDAMRFNWQALTGKAPGSFIQLQDKNTGRVVGQAPVQGSGQAVTMTFLEPLDPSHTYHIFTDYPSEGGATSGIDFNFGQLQQDTSPQGQAAAQKVREFWTAGGGGDQRAYAGNNIFDQAFSSYQPPAQQTPAASTAAAPAAPTGRDALAAPMTVGGKGRPYVYGGQIVQEVRQPNGTATFDYLGTAPPGVADYTDASTLQSSGAPASTSPTQPSQSPNSLIGAGLSDAASTGGQQTGITPQGTSIQLPSPSQINPAVWDSLGQTGQQFMLGAYSAAGFDPTEALSQINATRPSTARAPTDASTSFASSDTASAFG